MQVLQIFFFADEVSNDHMNVEYFWTNEIVLLGLSQTSQINKIII